MRFMIILLIASKLWNCFPKSKRYSTKISGMAKNIACQAKKELESILEAHSSYYNKVLGMIRLGRRTVLQNKTSLSSAYALMEISYNNNKEVKNLEDKYINLNSWLHSIADKITDSLEQIKTSSIQLLNKQRSKIKEFIKINDGCTSEEIAKYFLLAVVVVYKCLPELQNEILNEKIQDINEIIKVKSDDVEQHKKKLRKKKQEIMNNFKKN